MAASKGIVATLLLLVLLLLGAGLAGVVMDKNGGNALGLDDTQYWVVAGLLAGCALIVLIAIIVVLARRSGGARAQSGVEFEQVDMAFTNVARAPDAPTVAGQPDPAPADYAHGPKVVVYDLPEVQPAYRSWTGTNGGMTYTYPRGVESAVYSNDHLDVGGGQHLKLRTLIAGPEDPGPLPDDQATPAIPSLSAEELPEPYRSKLLRAAPRPVAAPATESEAFVAQLDEARRAPKAAKPRAGPTYFGYPGDVHPVEDIEGIGAIYGDKLRAAGVHTTDRLCYENTEALAAKVGVPRKTVETWKHMAELVKVKGVGPQYAEAMARAGIKGIADLKRRRAAGLAEQVTSYLDSLQASVVGNPITENRVAGWQKNAARMKRVKLQVPEK